MQTAVVLIEKYCNPFSCPLSDDKLAPRTRQLRLPNLPQEIWLEIFHFATHVHQHATIRPLDPFISRRVSYNAMAFNTPSLSMRTKVALVLVCRSWWRIALQILYNYIVIPSPARAVVLLEALQRSSQDGTSSTHSHGHWTRHIAIHTHARGTNDILFLQTVFRIFQACPNLQMLSGSWNYHLPLDFLAAISKLYGPSLQGLRWNGPSISDKNSTCASPEFFGCFSSLRVLDLYGWRQAVPKSSTITLPYVRDLVLSNSQGSLETASALRLPSLQNITLKTYSEVTDIHYLIDFLKVHGTSLHSVDLHSSAAYSETNNSESRRTLVHVNPDIFLQNDRCPNLRTLTFAASSPPLSSNIRHPLRRIGLRGVRSEALLHSKPSCTKDHLMAFTPERYPNLEVVRTIGYLVEAEADGVIKDVFIWWAENFSKNGVDFLDGEGVLWEYCDSSPPIVIL